jgi:hypothetical protein
MEERGSIPFGKKTKHDTSVHAIQSISVRFEVFIAVTMKNVVFWDIRTQFVLHGRHIMSLLQSSAS